jgi:hypothetical protein
MASLRKKPVVESRDAPPVSTVPIGAAKLPPKAAETETKPVEIEQPDPVAAAEKQALKQRLAEVENAEALTRAAVSQSPPRAAEPQQLVVPEAVERWLAEHPQYTNPNDAVAQAEIHLANMKTIRDGKTWDHPDFIPTIERHLGIAPTPDHGRGQAGNGQSGPVQIERPSPAPTSPRYEAPAPRQRTYSGPTVSAPPTRASPSMTTGRPVGRRVPLTDAQREMAKYSGVSEEEYAKQLEKMERLKREGAIQDG